MKTKAPAFLIVALSASLCASAALAQVQKVEVKKAEAKKAEAKTKVALPKGEEVIAQYIEATGGKAAYEKLTNRVGTGTIELAAANLKGKVSLTQAAPGSLVNVTELGAAGKTTQGTDGKLAWEISTFTGERVLDGAEKEAFLAQALFNSEIRWQERYSKAECEGIEDIDGKPSYKINLTTKAGKTVLEYYDVKTHLLNKQTSTTTTPMGEISVDVFPSDYKKIDGVLMPMTAKQKVLGQELTISFDEIKHNVELPKDAFAPPKSIVELAKKKAK